MIPALPFTLNVLLIWGIWSAQTRPHNQHHFQPLQERDCIWFKLSYIYFALSFVEHGMLYPTELRSWPSIIEERPYLGDPLPQISMRILTLSLRMKMMILRMMMTVHKHPHFFLSQAKNINNPSMLRVLWGLTLKKMLGYFIICIWKKIMKAVYYFFGTIEFLYYKTVLIFPKFLKYFKGFLTTGFLIPTMNGWNLLNLNVQGGIWQSCGWLVYKLLKRCPPQSSLKVTAH